MSSHATDCQARPHATASAAAPVAVARQPPATPRPFAPCCAWTISRSRRANICPRPIFGYIAGAAETNRSLHENRLAFDELGFVPRALTDVSNRSQQTTLFGRTYASPFGIAPMGVSALFAYRADVALARAAATANVPMILSASSLIRLEDLATEGRTTWFQAYPRGDASHITPLIERVARAGYEILVVTVGYAGGRQSREQHQGRFQHPAAAHRAAGVGRHHPPAMAVRHLAALLGAPWHAALRK